MAATRIQDLNAYSMAQITQSLNKFNKDYTAYSNRDTFDQHHLRDPYSGRAQFKSGSGYGIEDEYRYMQSQGFVGEKAGGSAPAAETQAETTTTTKTDPAINNVYNDQINNRESQPQTSNSNFINTYVNSGSTTHAGLGSVKRAQDAGMSIQDILNAGRDQNFQFASGASSYLNEQRNTERDTAFQNQIAALASQQESYLNDLRIEQDTRLNSMAAEQTKRADELATGQRTYQQNQARSGQLGALQIGGGSQTPRTGGTQGFKRRKLQINPVTANALEGILGANKGTKTTNTLNV